MGKEEDAAEKVVKDELAAAEKKDAAEKVVKEELARAKAEKEAAAKADVHDKGGSDGKSPIEDAKETLKKLEEQNKIMAKNVDDATKLQAEMMISGKTPAGAGSKKQSKEDKEIEDSKRFLEGTGFGEELFPDKE